MNDRIVWKEAKNHHVDEIDDKGETETFVQDHDDIEDNYNKSLSEDDYDDPGDSKDTSMKDHEDIDSYDPQERSIKNFSYHRLNLRLRRNLSNLADATQHRLEPKSDSDNDELQKFNRWVENALVAISPNADILLFYNSSPEKVAFIAKLRLEPADQYTTRALDIPLDYDEQVTSLLCIPIMSTHRISSGTVDWTALVFGLSSGYIKFYTEQSVCLLSLNFCDQPVVNLRLQTQRLIRNARSQSHFATIVDELFVTHRGCAILVDGIGLYENLRISKQDIVRNKSNYEPAYNIKNLPTLLTCRRWAFEESRESRVTGAELLGMRHTTRFDILKSNSINYDHIPSKSCTRAVISIGSNPFLACYKEAKEAVSHSYTEMLGSLLPFWSKPEPSKVQINETSCSSRSALFDKGRLATSIVASPDKRLAAVTDDFGRVMLVDITNWLVLKIWKGYRNAQCGWIEIKRNPGEATSPYALFLVIYAPKRGLLEVWSAQKGPRVAAFNVGKNCRLLYAGHSMLNMRAEIQNKSQSLNMLIDRSYSNNCYLLNSDTETVFSIEIPYTYSLHKFGDLKSRDRLIIVELTEAMQQDSEVNTISEIIERLVLTESIELAIQKLATNLAPENVSKILENLINKIMKNYDNQIGETISLDDKSIVELCKRVIRLCSIFIESSKSSPTEISIPEVNQRLINQYEEHPKEIEEFADELGWDVGEVLRYLSLSALESSFQRDGHKNTWPDMGEPLSWFEFVSCFDLDRIKYKLGSSKCTPDKEASSEKVTIRLKKYNRDFLDDDKIIKTSIFIFGRLCEHSYKARTNLPEVASSQLRNLDNSLVYLEPSSRLILLFQFWLSTKLCNHWTMWVFLQNQLGMITDELRVTMMTQNNDDLLVESWKLIYLLITESSNIYGAIIATVAIRSDTLRMLDDDEKRTKLECQDQQQDNEQRSPSVDWECLCVDAERMSILCRQLEDVFLLSLLLAYSPNEGKLVNRFVYRVARISAANILRNGPTIVSELVAQWVVQTGIDAKIFTQPYGANSINQADQVIIKESVQKRANPFFLSLNSPDRGSDEHSRELLHHVRTAFPRSLDSDVILLNCIWEFCNRWTTSQVTIDKNRALDKVFNCLSLLSNVSLEHNSAGWAYKTFFQQTFERLVLLIEKNSTILSPKCLRSRDALSRRELGMGESCLEGFIVFCFKLSEVLLNTCRNAKKNIEQGSSDEENRSELRDRLLSIDEWWSTPTAASSQDRHNEKLDHDVVSEDFVKGYDCEVKSVDQQDSKFANRTINFLVNASISSSRLFDVDILVELNRLATIMLLIFKLRIIKTYPLSIIGEEARQLLKLDLQQSPSMGIDIKNRSGLLQELRHKFARKCIVGIVTKLTEEQDEYYVDVLNSSDCRSDESGDDDVDTNQRVTRNSQDIDMVGKQSSGSTKVAENEIKQQCRAEQRLAASLTSQNASSKNDSQQNLIATVQTESNESMSFFTHLLSLTYEWQINSDELQLEFVFELYRCNHDKLGSQVANRIRDKQTLANGLLKISTQRVLVLFGLSPKLSASEQWLKRVDKWSLFQPNVASWLKSVQQEEERREIAHLNFSESLRQPREPRNRGKASDSRDHGGNYSQASDDFESFIEQSLGFCMPVLKSIRDRSKIVLESATNYLDGQANRLAYDLLQLLESSTFEKFLAREKDLWSARAGNAI